MIVDLAIVGFTGFFVWRGIRRGLVRSLAGIVGFLVSAAAAVYGYKALSAVVRPMLGIGRATAHIASALVIFVGLSLLFWLAGGALTKLLRWTKWGALNAAAGGALSGMLALAWVSAVLMALSVIPLSHTWDHELDRSALAGAIVEATPGVISTVADVRFPDMLALFLPREERVAVAATAGFDPFPSAELRLFDLANAERARRGLRALRWHEAAAETARAHAADMFRRGFFAHRNPEGVTPGGRLRARRVRFTVVAENLALAPTVEDVHGRLMASPRHRRALLSARYRYVGIGAMLGRQGVLVAQELLA